jgi:hypothetical protein
MTEEITYTIKYPPRSIVYDIAKARVGVLEKVCIKSYRVSVTAASALDPIIIYTDTYNWLWTEDALCPESEAVELSIAYYTLLLARLEAEEDE